MYFAFQQWKNFANQLRIDKVIAMSLVYYFFGTVYSYEEFPNDDSALILLWFKILTF